MFITRESSCPSKGDLATEFHSVAKSLYICRDVLAYYKKVAATLLEEGKQKRNSAAKDS